MKTKQFCSFMFLLLIFAAMAFSIDKAEGPPKPIFAQGSRTMLLDEDGNFSVNWTHPGYGGKEEGTGVEIPMDYFEVFIKRLSDDSIIIDGLYVDWVAGQDSFSRRFDLPFDSLAYDAGAEAINARGQRSGIAWANYGLITQPREGELPPKCGSLWCSK